MRRWKTEAPFASWLGLGPDNCVTGSKVLRKGTRGRPRMRFGFRGRFEAASTCVAIEDIDQLLQLLLLLGLSFRHAIRDARFDVKLKDGVADPT